MTRYEAIDQLRKTERGRNVLCFILEWMEEAGGLGLDQLNQQAALHVIASVWQQPGSTRDLMREAIGK